MPVCRVLGHRYRFRAEGRDMVWACERCRAVGGTKSYPSPAEAARYATAFDRRDVDPSGGRRTPLTLLPLRAWRRIRQR